MTELPAPINEFSQYMLVIRGRSPRTVKQYEVDLILFFKYINAKRNGMATTGEVFDNMVIKMLGHDFASSVSREDIIDFLGFTALRRENGARTRARKLSAIKSFYKYYNGVLCKYPSNPAVNIDSPKIPKSLPKHLTEAESIDLLNAVENEEGSYRERNYCIITFFLNCGMRLSELVGINLSDIDRSMEKLLVRGKGAKERMMYLNDACRDALSEYLKVRVRTVDDEPLPEHKNALFLSKFHRRISKEMVQKIVYKYLDDAGLSVKKLSVHKLRHTAATLLYKTGKVDIRVLKDILGHEQLNTTQIYTHVSDDDIRKAMGESPLAQIKPENKKPL